LLGTTGTELLLFGLLIGSGVYHARTTGRDAKLFLAAALIAVSLFYFLCPEDSAVQQHAGASVMRGMATLQAEMMRAGGANVMAKDTSVVGSFDFTYARGCMGLSYLAMAILCLLVQPVSWGRRMAGLVAVIAGMTFFNLLRLSILFLLWDRQLARTYDVFHAIGGGLFAAGAFALYLGVLYLRSPRSLAQPSVDLRPGESAISGT
ncbi:MAG TPA: archaeosortase/exosortase family protein, partial [Planctomycetota bacterium]|nr:archaeosortase/exosortase family protein [Planctomycetota bacterium]